MRYFKWKVSALQSVLNQLEHGITVDIPAIPNRSKQSVYGEYIVYIREIDPTFNYEIIDKAVEKFDRHIHMQIWRGTNFKDAYMHVLRRVRKLGNITIGSVTD